MPTMIANTICIAKNMGIEICKGTAPI